MSGPSCPHYGTIFCLCLCCAGGHGVRYQLDRWEAGWTETEVEDLQTVWEQVDAARCRQSPQGAIGWVLCLGKRGWGRILQQVVFLQ